MKLISRVFTLFILMSVLVAACNSHSGTSDTAYQDAENKNMITDLIMKFHIERQVADHPILILTYYKIPYSGEFNAIQVNENGELAIWFRVSQMGGSGLYYADLSQSEISSVINTADSVKDANIYYQEGSYALTISLGKFKGFNVISCSEVSCPAELCNIFQLATDVLRKKGKLGEMGLTDIQEKICH